MQYICSAPVAYQHLFFLCKTRWEVLVQDCALAKFLNNSSYSSKIVSKEEYFLEKITYQEKTKKNQTQIASFGFTFVSCSNI